MKIINFIQPDIGYVFGENSTTNVCEIIDHLPVIHQMALEFSLMGEASLDFHFNLTNTEDWTDHIEALKVLSISNPKNSKKLTDFLSKWNNKKSEYNNNIEELFLEFDTSNSENFHLPSVFVKIRTRENEDHGYRLIKNVLLQLKSEAFFDLNQTLIHNCVYNVPTNSYITNLGVMLARPEPVLRININNIKPDELIPFLQKNGWEGNSELLLNEFNFLTLYCDKVLISFDCYNNKILPKIGLESFILNQPEKDFRWKALLNKLIEKKQCSSDKRDFMLSWSAVFNPVEAPWDVDFMINSLSKPANELELIKRKVSHVKSTIEGNHIHTKGYVGAGQVWIKKEDKTRPEIKPIEPIHLYIEKSISFLLKQQQQSGFWRDYLLYSGTSDEWVTAYVAIALWETKNEKVKNAVQHAWSTLKETFRTGNGWAFNFMMPTDSDCTSWGLKLARLVEPTFCETEKKVLHQYFSPKGELVTYVDPESIGNWCDIPKDSSLAGWIYENDCVLSSVFDILPEKSLPIVLKQQKEDGTWKSYWWSSDIYATVHMLIGCIENKIPIPNEDKVVVWVKQQAQLFTQEIELNKEVNIFYLSLFTLLLIEMGIDKQTEQFISYILIRQTEEGYWKGSAELVLPMPGIKEIKQKEDYHLCNDHNHLFTTATVLRLIIKYNDTTLKD
jgi:hypothetical protein